MSLNINIFTYLLLKTILFVVPVL